MRKHAERDYYSFVDSLYADAASALNLAEQTEFPEEDNWDDESSKVNEGLDNVKQIKGICGKLINSLNEYVEKAAKVVESIKEKGRKESSQESAEDKASEKSEEKSEKKKGRYVPVGRGKRRK